MFRRSILSLVVLLISFGTSNLLLAQDNIQQNENLPRLPELLRTSPNDSDVFVRNDQIQKEQAQHAEVLRREDIKRFSEKLFQMVGELKDQINKDNAQTLSLDTLKKAEQVEKLAHSLKQKIKN
ncbi:MAG TPA: hypothetical protein VGF44_07020 [Terriglobales bacterium]|jgi:hypothetical protein